MSNSTDEASRRRIAVLREKNEATYQAIESEKKAFIESHLRNAHIKAHLENQKNLVKSAKNDIENAHARYQIEFEKSKKLNKDLMDAMIESINKRRKALKFTVTVCDSKIMLTRMLIQGVEASSYSKIMEEVENLNDELADLLKKISHLDKRLKE